MLAYAIAGLAGLLMLRKGKKGGKRKGRQTRKYGFVWKGRVRTFTTLARAQHRLHELRSSRGRR